MRKTGRASTKMRRAAIVAAGIVVVAGSGLASAASAAPAANPPPTGAVSTVPAAGTPALVKTPTAKYVRQLAQCGGTMYAAGTFTQVSSGGSTSTRDGVFSFSATAPYALTSWAPSVNGTVNSIALSGNCATAYLGGSFTQVGGTMADNIAAVSTSTGALVSGWGAGGANGEVDTLALTGNGHLLAGGHFTTIGGSSADAYFASLNPATGSNDGFLALAISGHYHFCDSTGRCNVIFPTQVYNQQLSHHGTLDLAEGVFTSVGGKPRQQIFMLNLATSPATVTGWTSPQWDGSNSSEPYNCWFSESFYIRSAAWSPSDSTVYIADTGNRPYDLAGTLPRSGLCDAAAAFPATQTSVTDQWINYTGCDSLFSVAADNGAVYVAGHPRWSENSDDCNAQGPGAIPDQGLQGLNPASGNLLTNPKGTEGIYSMSRANADDMLVTSAGLWIASSNRFGSDVCGEQVNHAGICFLPYPAG